MPGEHDGHLTGWYSELAAQLSLERRRSLLQTQTETTSKAKTHNVSFALLPLYSAGDTRSATFIQNSAPIAKALASNRARRKCYESCSRSCCEQFVADPRGFATPTRTQSSARENACQRHLLHRCTSNARTFSRIISAN